MSACSPVRTPRPAFRAMHAGCEETCRFHSGVSVVSMANAEVCSCGDSPLGFARGLVRTLKLHPLSPHQSGCRAASLRCSYGATLSATASLVYKRYTPAGQLRASTFKLGPAPRAARTPANRLAAAVLPSRLSSLRHATRSGAIKSPAGVLSCAPAFADCGLSPLARSLLSKPAGTGSSRNMQTFVLQTSPSAFLGHVTRWGKVNSDTVILGWRSRLTGST